MWSIIKLGYRVTLCDLQQGELRTLCNWYRKHIWDRFMLLHSVTFIVKNRDRGREDMFSSDCQTDIWFWWDLWWSLLLWCFVLHSPKNFFSFFLDFPLEEVMFSLPSAHLSSSVNPSLFLCWCSQTWKLEFHPNQSCQMLKTRFRTCRLTRRLMSIERRVKLACDSLRQQLITH